MGCGNLKVLLKDFLSTNENQYYNHDTGFAGYTSQFPYTSIIDGKTSFCWVEIKGDFNKGKLYQGVVTFESIGAIFFEYTPYDWIQNFVNNMLLPLGWGDNGISIFDNVQFFSKNSDNSLQKWIIRDQKAYPVNS